MTNLVQIKSRDNADVENASPTFADFWLLYPKRIARMEAEKSWSRLCAADRVAALVGLVDWRQVWLRDGRLQFVPNASTWLNQQRWTDELPEMWGAGHASHVSAVLPERGERVSMPDHVRALLAKLRGK